MPRGGKRPGAGRPLSHRIAYEIRLTDEERDRMDALRASKPRGVWLGKLILAQPLSPFQRFSALTRTTKK